jgi:hypothetical protein
MHEYLGKEKGMRVYAQGREFGEIETLDFIKRVHDQNKIICIPGMPAGFRHWDSTLL